MSWCRLLNRPLLEPSISIYRSSCCPCPIICGWQYPISNTGWNFYLNQCWLNGLFRRRSNKTSKLRVTGLCAGNSPVTGEFPAQMASNAENVSIWWRHHDFCIYSDLRDQSHRTWLHSYLLSRLISNSPVTPRTEKFRNSDIQNTPKKWAFSSCLLCFVAVNSLSPEIF